MTLFDVLILGVISYSLITFLSGKKQDLTRNTRYGFAAILLGLSLVGLIYLADIVTMHILPLLMPEYSAMAIMNVLHLHFNWFAVLFSVGAISLGHASANRGVFLLISKLEESEKRLKGQLAARQKAEKTVRKNQQLLKAVVDTLPAMINAKDQDSRYIFMNQYQADLYRVSSVEAVSRTATELLGPTYGNFTASLDREVFTTCKAKTSYEEHWTDPTGKSYVFLTTKVPLCNENGDVTNVVTVALDITERKQIENAIRESKERFRDFAEEGSDWFWEMDSTLRYTYMSPSYSQYSGISPEDVVGYTRAELYAPVLAHLNADEVVHWKIFERCIEERQTFRDFEQKWIHPNGGLRYFLTGGKPIFDSDGHFAGYRGVATDITERKRFEKALRESEARLVAIMENAPAEIYLKDVEGRYILINGQFAKRWDVTHEGVSGKLPADICHQKEFAATARSHDLGVLGSGDVIEREDVVLQEDGLHTLHTIKFPVRDAGGEIVGLGAIATDVTQRTKLQQIKNEFISSVSHELRTPMTSVLGALGLVRGGAAGRLPEKARSMIEIAHKNCNRLVRLLNDILDIEMIGSGKAIFEITLLDPGPLVRDSIETVAAYADQQGVEIRFKEGVRTVAMKADGDRLVQVLINLLSNAIKFSPRGSVVDVRISQHDRSVRISVADQGPGIPEAFHDRVFERFAQADATDSRSKGGSGLGLSICKLIIDGHGGKIAFDTEIGKGTTFYVELTECAQAEELSGDDTTAAVGDTVTSHSIDRALSARLKSQSGRKVG